MPFDCSSSCSLLFYYYYKYEGPEENFVAISRCYHKYQGPKEMFCSRSATSNLSIDHHSTPSNGPM